MIWNYKKLTFRFNHTRYQSLCFGQLSYFIADFILTRASTMLPPSPGINTTGGNDAAEKQTNYD